MKLTNDTIKDLSTDDPRGYDVADESLKGFYARVLPKRIIFFIRYGGRGERRRKVIGEFGTITLDEARKLAKPYLAKATLGLPLEEKSKDTTTFGSWADTYLENVKKRKKRPDADEMYIKRAKKLWKRRRLDDIEVSEISGAMANEAEAARARLESQAAAAVKKGRQPRPIPPTAGHATANRWLAALRACLSAAVKAKLIKDNPAKAVEPYREAEPRDRVLSDEEMKALLDAIAAEKDKFLRCAFRLLIETGARRSEVLRAKWSDFDLDAKEWTIPSPKSGRKQVLPLTDSTVALLSNTPHMAGSPWLVPGKNPEHHRHDLRKPWERLCEKAKLEGVHIHDIRRSFGLRVARKAGLHVASRLLRHSSVLVTERVYAPLGLDELRSALDKANINGEVVRFKKRAKREGSWT